MVTVTADSFGGALRIHRAHLRLSQVRLAKKIRISQSRIHLLETGVAHPTEREILSTAKLFSVSADALRQLAEARLLASVAK